MSTVRDSFTDKITQTVDGMRVWQQERVIFEVTERVCELMEEDGVTKAELARRLGKTKGYITQLLGGDSNMTMRTVSDIFLALGRSFVPNDVALTTDFNETPTMEVVYPLDVGQPSWDMSWPATSAEKSTVECVVRKTSRS